ncbi:hydroxyacid dehydrogenase [Chloroflexota bacterium]
MKKVLICEFVDSQAIDILRKEAEVIYLPELPGRTLEETIKTAHAVAIRGGTQINRNLIEQGENLLIIAKHGVGYDNIDVETATQKKIVVVNTPEANYEAVTELNMGFMLALSRNITSADRALRQGTLTGPENYIGVELKGKNLGIIGLGRIGSEMARKCQSAFDMTITCYDPYLPADIAQKAGFRIAKDINTLLTEADYVVICVPLNKETANLIGRKELTLMKESSFLINSSRGGIVDEKALYDSLKQKKITGAAMDVFTKEPPSPDNPLLNLDNFIATPHLGAGTEEAMKLMALTVAEEILRVFQGEKPKYPVNPEIYG